MRIVRVSSDLPEERVVIGHVGWHEGIRGFNSRYPLQPEFLDESILHRKMRPLDTPLGRRRVRADAINIEFEERPPELRMAVATCRGCFIYAENEATRRIVDEDQRGARRTAIFEPMMLAAVDLDQLPNARPPHTRLLNLWRPQLARNP